MCRSPRGARPLGARRFSFIALPLAATLLSIACTGNSGTVASASASGRLLEHRAGLDLSGRSDIGGLSGLHIGGEGRWLTAISDDGRIITGPLQHDDDGDLRNWKIEDISPLPGLPEGGGKATNDAEALAREADGSWLVALEHRHRILRYPAGDTSPEGEAVPIAVPDSLGELPANKGIEALTVRPDGMLVAIAEAKETEDGQHRLYLRQGDRWIEKRYRTAPFYAPADAAALPNGDILVLDRGFSLLGGVRARLVHVRSDDLVSKDIVEGVVLGELTPPIGVDNFEGLSIRTRDTGEVVLYVVSDDNFSPLQRTLLIQYTLHLPNPH